MTLLRTWCGLCVALAAGCASARFDGRVLRRSDVVYAVGPLAPEWHQIVISGGDLAFRHKDGGAIFVNATCSDIGDLPLDVLTNHLLFGMTGQRPNARHTTTLDGREALYTSLIGSLDGVSVELLLIVMKKNGCTFDLQLAADHAQFARRRAEFERFVAGFAKREKG